MGSLVFLLRVSRCDDGVPPPHTNTKQSQTFLFCFLPVWYFTTQLWLQYHRYLQFLCCIVYIICTQKTHSDISTVLSSNKLKPHNSKFKVLRKTQKCAFRQICIRLNKILTRVVLVHEYCVEYTKNNKQTKHQ